MNRTVVLGFLVACTGESGELVIGGQQSPTAIAVNGQAVTFLTGIDNVDIVSVPLEGGATRELAWYGTSRPVAAIIADEGGVYWINADSTNVALHAMMLPTGATTPVEIGWAPGADLRAPIALDDSAVYFESWNGDVWRTPKSGTGAVKLGTSGGGQGLAFDGEAIWVTIQGGARRLPIDGSASTDYRFTDMTPAALAVDAENLYALSTIDGSITSVPKVGGDSSLLVSELSYGQVVITPLPLIYSNGSLVLADDSGISEVATADGTRTMLADSVRTSQLAADADAVYWTDIVRGEVRRVPH